jgi:putative ABC transport system permease protein
MTFLSLITSHLRHGRVRTSFTVMSVVTAFLLLGLLLPLDRLFQSRVQFADAQRLIVTNKASLMRPLPVNYEERLEEIDGVEKVAAFTYFGAFYRDPGNQVAAIVTDPRNFADMVGETVFHDARQFEDWTKEPAGIAVGRQLADRFGWKAGDLIPVHSSIYPRSDGSQVWTFRVMAIFDAAGKNGNTDSMVINYDYFDAARPFGKGTVGWFAVRVHDAGEAGRIAETIDAMFGNSPDETTTTTEKAFAQSFLRQVGDFGSMISTALVLVFYTLILVTANTMAQSVRERFGEIAVLKTLGYRRAHIAALILGESLLIVGACSAC